MASSKELLEVLRLLAKLSAKEKDDFIKCLRDLQDSADSSSLPASDPATTKG